MISYASSFLAGIATLLFAAACTSPAAQSKAPAGTKTRPTVSLPAGTFVVVDARRASDVAAPLTPGDMPIGEQVKISSNGLDMAGISCDDWHINAQESKPPQLLNDPNLIDVTLGPADSLISSGDQRLNQYFKISCEGEIFASILQIDERVLIMPWANSAINLVLERPLTRDQTLQYQRQLKSMKFYDGPVHGVLDEAALKASRLWYEYRARLAKEQPIPARPAITQNLLDALNVLER